jgi:hypothetical protein
LYPAFWAFDLGFGFAAALGAGLGAGLDADRAFLVIFTTALRDFGFT